MDIVRKTVPRVLAITFGILTLIILGIDASQASLLTGWASFLAAVALLLGIINLFSVHFRRMFKGNFYSLVLIAGLAATLVMGFTGLFGGAETMFTYVQAPIEAALGALLAFFLFFAALRLLRRNHSVWSFLFIAIVIIFLLGTTLLPAFLSDLFTTINYLVSLIFVSAGVRGILIGVALGTITVTLRLLLGSEQPYNK
jgi:hypothetical protein